MKPLPSIRHRRSRVLPVLACLAAAAVFSAGPGPGFAADDTPAAATVKPPAAPETLKLRTSDGVELAAWYYPVARGDRPRGTVILVHDLGGSHKTVDPLAKGLQQLGYAVVAPDLRGHGASTAMESGQTLDAKTLRRNDLLAIAVTEGGRVREQAALRGDLEAVRGWIKRKSDVGELNIDRLCVVGCGTGATLAALWTVADSVWPPTTTGAQGRQVRALALVSPAWTAKGVSLQPALKTDVLRRDVPILIVSGKSDRDALRLVEQFKGLRPKAWFVQEPGRNPETAKDLKDDPANATFFSVQLDTTLSADKLAADRSTNAASVIDTFLGIVLDRDR